MPAPPGTYTLAGASTPTNCPKAFLSGHILNIKLGCYYNPFTALAACLPCQAGFYCDQEGMSDNLNSCPPGYYCPTG